MMRRFLKVFFLFLCMSCWTALKAQTVHDRIQLQWQLIETDRGKQNPLSKIILYNTSSKSIACRDWSLWFNFIRGINVQSVDKRYKIEHQNGDFYHLTFQDRSLSIPPKDSIEIVFITRGILPNFTDVPAGVYVKYDTEKENRAYPLPVVDVVPIPYTKAQNLAKLNHQYKKNLLAQTSDSQILIPTPVSVVSKSGRYDLSSATQLWFDELFEKEADYLKAIWKETWNISLSAAPDREKASISLLVDPKLTETGAYRLLVDEQGIRLTAGTVEGIFYAIQSLRGLTDGQSWGGAAEPVWIPRVEIADKPRFGYRGLMIDVARNFHSKEAVLKIVDLMAMYKFNTLHLHLTDDEGWRLEIPGLPELTEIGSRRSAAYLNGQSLQPSYGSGIQSMEKAYFTRADFIEILQYADERHIQVIPEIETPGHARAAVKSMEARYEKYKAKHDMQEAERYLLSDLEDQSIYLSAQRWNDNVMNAALPSTYRFIAKVIDEIKDMYQEAGLPWNVVHLGGDEVPRGSWEKSPQIKQLMDSLRLQSVYEVWPYYINKIAELCAAKGLHLAGWEEMGMVNKGKGMKPNPSMVSKNIQLDVWNNVMEGGQEDLAYRLANTGYKVIFTSANNFYLDLAWDTSFEEPGHSWAGFIDLYRSYSFLPTNFFLNITHKGNGDRLPTGFFDKKERLTAKGKENIIGIKAAMWSEKIKTDDRVEYMLFPRAIALAERAWSAERDWEEQSRYDPAVFHKEYAAFAGKLGKDELKKLDVWNGGYHYRLPYIGIQLEGEMLYCNTEYPGFTVYYTTDGSEPNNRSAVYTHPIQLDKTKNYRFRIITEQGRMGAVTTLDF